MPNRSAVEVDGVGSPVLVLPRGLRVRWTSIGEAPIAGFPFLDRDQVPRAMYHLPASPQTHDGKRDVTLRWTCHEESGEVTQRDLVLQPTDKKEYQTGLDLDQCIKWVTHSFMDLAQNSVLAPTDSLLGGTIRRSWARARQIWLEPDPDEPRMELIIRLALDATLREAIGNIGEHPRRILLRVREQTPVTRVTEMDAACIRDYARRPGKTAFEKAGVSQRLMAVQRHASFDTLENRVACWTMDELHRRSLQWRQCHVTSRAIQSHRARKVQQLGRLAQEVRHGENLAAIAHGSLSHPVIANYPLQMESRYHVLYQTYQSLLRYRKVIDDAWTWRRPLWSDAVRQIMACTLVDQMGPPLAESAPYFRTEAERGRWLTAPSGPGPFATHHGPMYIIDAHDAEQAGPDWHSGIPAFWAAKIGMLGPDTILWWPDRGSVVVVWSHLWCAATATVQRHVDDAAIALKRFADGIAWESRKRLKIAGIIISTDSTGAAVEQILSQNDGLQVVGLTIPMRIDTTDAVAFRAMSVDLSAGITIAVQEVCT